MPPQHSFPVPASVSTEWSEVLISTPRDTQAPLCVLKPAQHPQTPTLIPPSCLSPSLPVTRRVRTFVFSLRMLTVTFLADWKYRGLPWNKTTRPRVWDGDGCLGEAAGAVPSTHPEPGVHLPCCNSSRISPEWSPQLCLAQAVPCFRGDWLYQPTCNFKRWYGTWTKLPKGVSGGRLTAAMHFRGKSAKLQPLMTPVGDNVCPPHERAMPKGWGGENVIYMWRVL